MRTQRPAGVALTGAILPWEVSLISGAVRPKAVGGKYSSLIADLKSSTLSVSGFWSFLDIPDI